MLWCVWPMRRIGGAAESELSATEFRGRGGRTTDATRVSDREPDPSVARSGRSSGDRGRGNRSSAWRFTVSGRPRRLRGPASGARTSTGARTSNRLPTSIRRSRRARPSPKRFERSTRFAVESVDAHPLAQRDALLAASGAAAAIVAPIARASFRTRGARDSSRRSSSAMDEWGSRARGVGCDAGRSRNRTRRDPRSRSPPGGA